MKIVNPDLYASALTDEQLFLTQQLVKHFLNTVVKPDMMAFKDVPNYVSRWEQFYYLGEDSNKEYFMMTSSYQWTADDEVTHTCESVTIFENKEEAEMHRHKLNVVHENKVVLN